MFMVATELAPPRLKIPPPPIRLELPSASEDKLKGLKNEGSVIRI